MDGFDQGGADPGERVEHEVAGSGVVGDEVGGQVRGHPGGVSAGAGDEPAAALRGEAALPDQDHRQHRRPGGVKPGRWRHDIVGEGGGQVRVRDVGCRDAAVAEVADGGPTQHQQPHPAGHVVQPGQAGHVGHGQVGAAGGAGAAGQGKVVADRHDGVAGVRVLTNQQGRRPGGDAVAVAGPQRAARAGHPPDRDRHRRVAGYHVDGVGGDQRGQVERVAPVAVGDGRYGRDRLVSLR